MDALDGIRRDPRSAGVFVDYDGTLAAIVAVASDARPLPGAVEVLTDLAAVLGRLAVVSGRPLAYLAEQLPADLELHGLYGLEARIDGRTLEHPGAARWRPAIDEVAGGAVAALAPLGVDVEHKGLSLTLHYRRAPEAEDATLRWARLAAERSGLHLRPAKRSVELHPPVKVDKGTVVEERSVGLSSVAYVGDDVGDLPAFDALERLAAAGVQVVKVAVRTPDVSEVLLARAHRHVDGPDGALELLRSLT